MIHVLVIAPNLPLRVGLRELLSAAADISVAAEAASLADAWPIGESVDLVLLADPPVDFMRSVPDWPAAALLVLSDDARVAQALAGAGGVWGILPLSGSEEQLAAAIHALAEGLWVASPALLSGLLRQPIQPAGEDLPAPGTLTGREQEVLQLMAGGLANKQIAVRLGISEHTVKFHLSSIYAKLGVASRTEAVTIGTRLGLIVL